MFFSRGQRHDSTRAILASPEILILDEATSNLDTESEQLFQASMANLLADRTTFVIGHRLSTIRRADLILLLPEAGQVIERGDPRATHGQTRLTSRNGVRQMLETRGENQRPCRHGTLMNQGLRRTYYSVAPRQKTEDRQTEQDATPCGLDMKQLK